MGWIKKHNDGCAVARGRYIRYPPFGSHRESVMSKDNARGKSRMDADMRAKSSKPSSASTRSSGAVMPPTDVQALVDALCSGSYDKADALMAKCAKPLGRTPPAAKPTGLRRDHQVSVSPASSGVHRSGFKGDSPDGGRTAAIANLLSDHFRIKFKVDYEESLMVTLPKRSEDRDARIMQCLSNVKPDTPIVMADVYGGVGGDSLAIWKLLDEMGRAGIIFVAQPVVDGGRFDRLSHNVSAYKAVAKKTKVKVHLFDKHFHDVVAEFLERGSGVCVHLLYMDPPWELPTGFVSGTQYGTAERPSEVTMSLILRMEADVFKPLKEKKALPPWYVCLKVPTPYVEFSLALKKESRFMRDYDLIRQIPSLNKHGRPVYYTLLYGHTGVSR